MMHEREKSDPVVVAVKPMNKAEKSAAELVEPRTGTKGNAGQQSMRRAQDRGSVSQALSRVRNVAKQEKKEKFTTLFCVETLQDALARHGKPEIFNTDQGSQFTGAAFTGVLADNGIAISMDGKGAWRDNVFVERLWRSVKYEEVYLRAYETVSEARNLIGRYLEFYNRASEHPSVYVVEEKRLCWLGCDPVGYLGFCRARSAMD